VKKTACHPKITVSADGRGVVSQAGTLLLLEAAGLAPVVLPRAVHDPEDPHRPGDGLRWSGRAWRSFIAGTT